MAKWGSAVWGQSTWGTVPAVPTERPYSLHWTPETTPDVWDVLGGTAPDLYSEPEDTPGKPGNLVWTLEFDPTFAYVKSSQKYPIVPGDTLYMQFLARVVGTPEHLQLQTRWYNDAVFMGFGPYLDIKSGEWVYSEARRKAPEGVNSFEVQVSTWDEVNPKGDGYVQFDEVFFSVTPSTVSELHLPPLSALGNATIEILGLSTVEVINGGFENGLEGWFGEGANAWTEYLTGQMPYGDSNVGTFTPVEGGNNPAIVSNRFPVKAGSTYTLSGWVKGIGFLPMSFRIDWLDANGGWFNAGTIEIPGAESDGVWRYKTAKLVAVDGAAFGSVRYLCYGVQAPNAIYGQLDNVSVTGPLPTQEWLDATPQSMVMKLSWGADNPAGLLTVPAAGGWDVKTYDPQRVLDPSNGGSPNAKYLRPGRPMRIGVKTPEGGYQIIRRGLIDEIEHDIYSQTGSMRGTDIVPLIVAAKLPGIGLDPNLPSTLRARARYLLNQAGLQTIVPVEPDIVWAANILARGGAEGYPDAYDQLPEGWNITGGGGTFGTSSGGAYFGQRAYNARGAQAAGFGIMAENGNVAGGKTYYFSGRHMVEGWAGAPEGKAWVAWFDEAGARLVDPAPLVWPVGATVYEARGAFYVAPAGATTFALVLDGMTGDSHWFDDFYLFPTLTDPQVGPLPDNKDASVWSLLATSAYDALHAMWIDRFGELRFRSFGEPRDNGFQIGGNGGLPISTLKTNASLQNLFTVVRAFDMDAPEVPVVKENPVAVDAYGVIPLTREKPVPDAEFWAQNVLNDRSGSALQYDTGTLYPRTRDELASLIELEMIDTVHIVVDDVTPTLDLTARLLGARLVADTDTGWTAEVQSYIPSSEWVDQEVPPVIPPVIPPTSHQETRYYNAVKDTRAARNSAGTGMGSGTEGELPVGAWQGWRNRAFIDFADISWAGVVSVDKAILELDTSSQVNVGFGSAPKVVVSRVTQSWNEGSSSSPSSGNATKYPGPSTTSTNQKTQTITRTENKAVSIDITGIVRDMKTTGAQHGVRIISAGEDSNQYTTEFWSRENSTSGKRPRLAVTVTVQDATGKPAEENVSD
jgi:hypothetical protein